MLHQLSLAPVAELSRSRDVQAQEVAETEWWYFSGHLEAAARQFGFMLTFFQRRTDRDRLASVLPIRWFYPVLHFAQFSFTDMQGGRFGYSQRSTLTHTSDSWWTGGDQPDICLGGWSIRAHEAGYALSAQAGPIRLDLTLTPQKPTVHFGQDGWVRKADGGAYYASMPRLTARGELSLDGGRHTVQGVAWMDREFGTWRMTPWEWLGLHLDNGWELMAYRIAGQEGYATDELTLVRPDGSSLRHLADEFTITPLGWWYSQHTGVLYPSGWRVIVPRQAAELTVRPTLAFQEVDGRAMGLPPYWEGSVAVTGRVGGHDVAGRGNAEVVRRVERTSLWRVWRGSRGRQQGEVTWLVH